jgi:hypothetical protein
MSHYKRITTDIKGIRAALERLEGGHDVVDSPDLNIRDLEAPLKRSRMPNEKPP